MYRRSRLLFLHFYSFPTQHIVLGNPCIVNADTWCAYLILISEIPMFGRYLLATQLYSIQTAQQPLYLLLRQVWKRILSTHFIHWSLSSECHHYPGTRTVYFITEIMSMYFSHPECLPYSGTRTVYFILGNFVYVFQSPRVSSLFRDTDCLLYCGTRTVCIVQAPGVLKKTKCLPCYVTESVCFVMASVFTITSKRLP